MKNYYQILQVSADASEEIIRSAYKALAKKYHPDVYQGSTDYATRKMKMINEAYAVLSDPQKRRAYDGSMKAEQEEVVSDIPAGDVVDKPYAQNKSDLEEHRGCSGCLSNILGIIFWIVVIAFVIRACGGSKDDIHDNLQEQNHQTQVQESTSNTEHAINLSEAARNIEMLFFHKPYTDLGSVEIHKFPERNDILEYIVSLGTDKETVADGCYVAYKNKLFGDDYYYATASTTQYYYAGNLKNNKPHGLGAIVGFSEGEGTYELQGEMMFYYVGEFKDGMKHGFGVEFNADECDITWALQDIGDSGSVNEENYEHLCSYLFNHVAYEGYWKENQYDGKGNLFEFPMYEDQYYFFAKYKDPLENYVFGHAYPDVTKGEWEDGEFSGTISIYESNRILFVGDVENGKENGWGTIYYSNGQIKYEGEFKAGKIHGFGSYYDEDGSLIYSGEWKNGDYAH